MKKIGSTLLILNFLFFLPIISFAKGILLNYYGSIHKYSGSIYLLKINEKIIACETPPVIIDNRMLVPVRATFESLGASAKCLGSSLLYT
jgi:N-acetylmuramoyl-L-alanine amidase